MKLREKRRVVVALRDSLPLQASLDRPSGDARMKCRRVSEIAAIFLPQIPVWHGKGDQCFDLTRTSVVEHVMDPDLVSRDEQVLAGHVDVIGALEHQAAGSRAGRRILRAM